MCDCKYHSECRDDSVCVQDPSGPIGPCTGDPQRPEIWAADATVGRDAWTLSHNIDYCVPACQALLDDQQSVRDTNSDLTEEYYFQFCPQDDGGGSLFLQGLRVRN
eukprot:jgi/Psemu1/306932/fgenesh1_kg.290_\